MNQQVTVAGWGDTDKGNGVSLSNRLMDVDVNVISNEVCDRSEGTVGGIFTDTYKNQIKPNMLCARANGKDACQVREVFVCITVF